MYPKDSTVNPAHAMHMDKPNSISDTTYGPPRLLPEIPEPRNRNNF